MTQEVRSLFLSFLDKASGDPVIEVHSETGMFTYLLNSLFKYNGTTHWIDRWTLWNVYSAITDYLSSVAPHVCWIFM